MRRVEDHHPVDHAGVQHRQEPGDHAAPVVGDDLPRADLRGDAGDVARELRQAIGVDLGRLRRLPVAAQVHRHGAEAGLRKRRQLPPPRVRRLGKPVQEEDRRAVTVGDVVKANVADLGEVINGHGNSAR